MGELRSIMPQRQATMKSSWRPQLGKRETWGKLDSIHLRARCLPLRRTRVRMTLSLLSAPTRLNVSRKLNPLFMWPTRMPSELALHTIFAVSAPGTVPLALVPLSVGWTLTLLLVNRLATPHQARARLLPEQVQG